MILSFILILINSFSLNQDNQLLNQQNLKTSDIEFNRFDKKLNYWIKKYSLKKENQIDLKYSDKTKEYINFYTKRAKKYFEITLGRGEKFKKVIEKELELANLPKELYLLPFIESSYKLSIVSSARAKGLWQLMPFTATSLGSKIDVFVDERSNLEKSTRHALKFLNELYLRYHDWELTFAAYNCGPGCVDRRIKEANSHEFEKIRDLLPKETQNYVPKFMAVLAIYKNQVEFDIKPKYEKLEDVFIFKLEHPAPLRLIATAAKMKLEDVQLYNPELITLITPPNVKNYPLKLPVSVKEIFLKNYDDLKDKIKNGFIFHRLRHGETISHLARFYGTSTKAIFLANNIKNSRRLQINQKLLIPVDPQKMARSKKRFERGNITIKNRKKYIHKIKRGESLWSVARDYNVNLTQIKKWNPKLNPKRLSVGTPISLLVRVYSNSKKYYEDKTKRVKQVFYKLKKGESLWSIGVKFKTPINELKRKNGIRRTTKLQIGQKLKLHISKAIYKKYQPSFVKN